MRLLPLKAFAHVFEPLQGKRIGFVRPYGNVGDVLIEWATRQLFAAYRIDWRVVDPADAAPDVEELVFGGGGNMGTMWKSNWHLRGRVLRWKLPITILPQSFTSAEYRTYTRVYVREQMSRTFYPSAELAPDLALGLDYSTTTVPTKAIGLFLRKDAERAVRRRWLTRDPIARCANPAEYLALAARYERIVTDRLHFAICGLILGRHTTLLPNSYHKNRSMYETWLRDLGCEFAYSARGALRCSAA